MNTWKRASLLIAAALSLLAGASAQDSVAIISGAVGNVSTVDGGFTYHQPVIAPVLAMPLGEHVLIESRADIRDFISQSGNQGSYTHQFFTTLEYLQADFIFNRRLTFVAGRYLTPFGIYSERLSPIWVRDFQEVPIIFPIGTRTTGSSNGAMVRGAAYDDANFTVNYAAYLSAFTNINQISSGRTAGGRGGVFLKKARLELGASYQRFLQGNHYNAAGAYLSFQPRALPADIKGEFAHSPAGYGYWLEADSRPYATAPQNWIRRAQVGLRAQQFVRKQRIAGDTLPFRSTRQIDGALNYYFPREVRFTFSYGRRFTAVQQANVWNIGLTYRFMLPIGGRS